MNHKLPVFKLVFAKQGSRFPCFPTHMDLLDYFEPYS